MSIFDFKLGDKVKLARSGEAGEVIALAEYARRPPLYLVEYVAGDGRQTEGWHDAEALTAA